MKRSSKKNSTNTPIIPDPWEGAPASMPEISTKPVVISEQLHPLISAGANIPSLPSINSSLVTIQLLLADWIKLNTKTAQQLTTNLTTMIGLLYANQLIPNY